MTILEKTQLAIHGGEKAVQSDPGDMFKWPIVTQEDEDAVLDVLRRGAMSGLDITLQFEQEFAAWQGTQYALATNNGTSALHCAMFGVGLGVGDEVICPSLTFWASVLQSLSLGASMVFADIDPNTLCIDPADIEHRISARTKAIIAVHYLGHPADMDPILAIARRHNLKVIEDVSHAQGGLYKGKKLGALGDVGAMSLMSGKSFAIGEGGILVTNDRTIYDRAIAFGHYERYDNRIETDALQPFKGLPLGGYKYRMHQMSSAVGRVQLKYYDQRITEIRQAMNYFWDLLADVPGIKPHRTPAGTSNMAGWYEPAGLYQPAALGGLSATHFAEAVRAEGSLCRPGINKPLHTHKLLTEADVYGHDRPTRIAFAQRDLIHEQGQLPVSETINELTLHVPWFRHYRPSLIEEHANAFRKVATNYAELLKDDPGNAPSLTQWPA
ncbi:MAG: DegT/DnrJ/EryC1/StrS family aminotransferase [Chloroflexi bacterium]|nr:DegT/DnrJ/EryC1/StrS family aminotransferase [Chloroflexota bacterium]